MLLRNIILALFSLLIVFMGSCAYIAIQSGKKIAKPVANLLISLIPPAAGSLIIILSAVKKLSFAGYYLYFTGMNVFLYALSRYSIRYCGITLTDDRTLKTGTVLLVFDAGQLLLNILTAHAFELKEVQYGGASFFQIVPYVGLKFHLIVNYCFFASVLLLFLIKTWKAPKIYRERYSD